MDEPSLGVSPIVVQEIARTVIQLNQQDELSIILVEQNARLALQLAQRGYVMETGSITVEGEAKSLLDNEYVKKAYLS